MDCPLCKNAMITLELSDPRLRREASVEIDCCTACNGVWLDAGELELLLGDAEKTRGLIGSFAAAPSGKEKKRKCPICDRKMEKIIVGREKPTLLIDRCAKGDGLWFDRGELSSIITRAELDADKRINRLLADMFGHKHNSTPTTNKTRQSAQQ